MAHSSSANTPAMDVKEARTLFFADDLDAIIEFYHRVLEWDALNQWEEHGTVKWVLLGPPNNSDIRLMYNKPEQGTVGQVVDQQAVLWLYVDDIEAAHSHASKMGGEPGRIKEKPGGRREFTITDPQGYRIYISGNACVE